MKRCMIDGKSNPNGEHIGGIFQFFLQMNLVLKKKDFDYIYVMWDGPNSGQKRFDIYPEYKANRDKNYAVSDYDRHINDYVRRCIAYHQKKREKQVDPEKLAQQRSDQEKFEKERAIVQNILENLFIRQIMVDEIEGDDLIAYYCLNKKENEKVVIVTSDRDLSQLITPTICLYLPDLKKKNDESRGFLTEENHISVMGFPHENVLIKKIICGDTSDNIKGITGVGEKTLFKLVPELAVRKMELSEVLEEVRMSEARRSIEGKKPVQAAQNILNKVTSGVQGELIYEINEKIIDLKHPFLSDEALMELNSVRYVPIDPEGRSFEDVYRIIVENQIVPWLDTNEFSRFFTPYARIIFKETKRFEKFSRND